MDHIVERHFCIGFGRTSCNRHADTGTGPSDERSFVFFETDIHDVMMILRF